MSGADLRSSLLGGFAAGFIYLFIALLTGGEGSGVALVGLIFVVAGTLVTMLIARVVSRSHAGAA